MSSGTHVLVAILLLTGFRAGSSASPNLITNGGFEQDSSNWETCWNYKCAITTESHSGGKAMKVTGRTMYYQGPKQSVNLGMAKRYSVEGWIKILNDNSKLLQYIEIEISESLSGGKTNYLSVARMPFLNSKSGWVHLSGDFVTPPSGLVSAQVYLQGPDPGIDFLVDDMSLTEIPENANWKAEANQRIDKLRKADIQFQVTTASGVDSSAIKLEINQTTSAFAFGTEVNARLVTSSSPVNRKYAQFIYDNYNWGVPGNALKWYEFEARRGNPNWDWGESAVKELVKNGINVRAHNMLWAVERFVPRWLKSMPAAQAREEINKHIKETALRYKGLVKHWDVNNELLHGNWYETYLNDADFTKDVFREIHKWDPDVKLFLNDYDNVGGGGATEAYKRQGMDYKKSNTYIYGMGVQSHFHVNTAPDPTIMKRRLDKLAEAGLPLWSTELDVQTTDENLRADWYETAMRMLFSHPAVEGIVMWGFWSQAHYAGEKASLVSGPEFRINAAGKRYIDLVKNQWRTNVVRPLSSGNNFSLRGFLGDYKVNVRVNGKVVKTQTFTLGKNGQTVNINIDGA